MIDYELAKKLKEAGFPQKLHDKEICCTQEGIGCHCEPYKPTLSELIEACGDGFQSVKHFAGRWFIYMPNEQMTEFKERQFPTLMEAVANLWLALNNK